jgi:NitT/TauT family transport system ATP-binding protein
MKNDTKDDNDTNTHLLELRHVGKTHGNCNGSCNGNDNEECSGVFEALKDVNLVIDKGEFVAILGGPGAGKSSLFRILSGLDKPSSGMVFHKGEELKGVSPYVGVVFQYPTLFPWLSARQNIEIVLKTKKIPPEKRKARTDELLDIIGIKDIGDRYPRELSGIAKQQVDFVRAIAIQPDILLLDEPFTSLDMISAEKLRNELMDIWLQRKTATQAILMITSDIEEAILMANRIIIIGKKENDEKGPGRIISDIKIDLPYPRQRNDNDLQSIFSKIHAILTG